MEEELDNFNTNMTVIESNISNTVEKMHDYFVSTTEEIK